MTVSMELSRAEDLQLSASWYIAYITNEEYYSMSTWLLANNVKFICRGNSTILIFRNEEEQLIFKLGFL